MKPLFKILFAVFFLVSATQNLNAQFLKKLQKKVEKEIEKEADRQVKKKADKTIDDAFDKTEDSTDDNKNQFNPDSKSPDNGKNEFNNVDNNVNEADRPSLVWSKYDFVPGDKIIFIDNLEGEENGEFPSRWDLVKGQVEVVELDNENAIMFRSANPEIIPYLKNRDKDYLPDIFTVEFDLYTGVGTFQVYLYDRKNQKSGTHTGNTSIKIVYNAMAWANNYSKLPDQKPPKRRWVHIAIAYNKGKLKAYFDETRLINIPHLEYEPKGITLYNYIFGDIKGAYYFVKNFKIAEGGIKYYERFLQDGKIVANGIRFDVNKATLRPESMGVINKIVTIMNENPDIVFSVEGHTDSDGDETLNQKLSENRAETVVNTMIKLGIASDRLSFKGLGENKPIKSNDTPEGKAVNRRVEFVKM